MPENPCAGTTDDVECIFSIMRDLIGKHFTLRHVRYAWRKMCSEFSKRLDPDLGFYYFTSSHDRLIINIMYDSNANQFYLQVALLRTLP